MIMFAGGHALKRTNSLFPSCEAALNNVAYSCPLASLLETARVTAHNKRPHLTASVCWSVTTTQMAKCVFSDGSWYARDWRNFTSGLSFLGHLPAIHCAEFEVISIYRQDSCARRQRCSDCVSSTLPFLCAHRPGWDAPPVLKPQR